MPAMLIIGSALAGLLAGPLLSRVVIRVPQRQPVLGGSADAGGRPGLLGLACGTLFAVAAWRFSDSWALPAYLLLFAALLAISVIDFAHHIVPNRILAPVVIASLALLAAGALADGDAFAFVRAVIGGTAAFAVLLVLNLASPQGLGMGDVKLAFLLGLHLGWLGWPLVAVGLFLGFVLGGIGGLVLILAGVRDRKDHIAFAPFLSAGAVLGVVFGTSLVSWYPVP